MKQDVHKSNANQLKGGSAKSKNNKNKDFSSSSSASAVDNKATQMLHSQEASKTLIQSVRKGAKAGDKGVDKKQRPHHHHHHRHHHKRLHHHKKKNKTRRDFPLDYYTNTPLWRLTGVRTNNVFAAPMLRSSIPQVGIQYNTRQFDGSGRSPLISNSYNAVNDGSNNFAQANFVNSQSQFYGQQQPFYQGQNNANVFGAPLNNIYPNSFNEDRNLNIQNMAATKKSMVPQPKNVGASSASSKYPAGFDIMSVADKNTAKSKIGEQRNDGMVKKTNIPLRPSIHYNNNVNGYKKVLISKDSATQPSRVDKSTLSASNKKDHITPNLKETIKEKDRIMSEINVEPLSEFPTDDDDQDSTARVEKNAIPRPSDFETDKHEMLAKDSIYDIPNSHPIEPLSGNEGGLHSFFPG